MLALPDVTLAIYEVREHRLAQAAIDQCLASASFGAVLVWSDRPDLVGIDSLPNEFFLVDPSTPRLDVTRTLWQDVPREVKTSHFLWLEWDSWIVNPGMWSDEFLTYDYVGAPWPWHPDRRVGNGGFSLRSTRLMRFLTAHPDEFPLRNPEDDFLCRAYRPALELHGFRWAPENVARRFSFERDTPRPSFGFHGLFNFPHVLAPEQLTRRLALATDYARGKSEWHEIVAP